MSLSEKIVILVLVSCLVCLTAVMDIKARNTEKQLKVANLKLDSVQRACDSLQDELLYNEITNGRYERAYQILLRRNPRAAEQYGNIISDETE
jgi:hypothetical protein